LIGREIYSSLAIVMLLSMRHILSLVYQLYYIYIKVLVDVAAHYEHGKGIKYHFKLGSIERSTDLDKEGIPRRDCKIPTPMKIEKIHQHFFFFVL
jgi:hypothetical protein